jgi:hypothetical protein
MSVQTISVNPDEIIQIERVGGDLQLVGSDGSDLQATGDGLRVERRTGGLAISCSGDLHVSAPRSAHIAAGAIGGDARLENLDGNIELRLVGGDAVLLNLTGTVQLNGMVGGDTHMENVANISVSPGSPSDAFDIGDRMRRKIDQATRRAEEKVRRAEEKIRRVEARAHQRPHVLFGWDPAPRAPQPAGETVSDEERMTILRMLQEKKITSEEADKLLAALEGNG